MRALLCILGICLTAPALAQYPTRPVTLVIPAPPGGPTDAGARILAIALTEVLGQRVVPENRAGAAATLGSAVVARAAPDGYVLGALANVGLTSAVAMGRELPYKLDDFIPLGIFAFDYTVITSNATGRWKSLQEVVEHAKQNPQKLSYGGPGVGSMGQLGFEVVKLAYGVDITFVPYAGTGPSVTALLGSHVDLASSTLSATMPFIKAGSLRALAVSSGSRVASLPDVPTVNELTRHQTPNFWMGLFSPAKLSAPVVERLTKALEQVLKDHGSVAQLEKSGLMVEYLNTEAARKLMADEVAVIANLAKSVKLQ
jgi:tripartite-type tricarboxylate transporter receptor subunit TctC